MTVNVDARVMNSNKTISIDWKHEGIYIEREKFVSSQIGKEGMSVYIMHAHAVREK
jgi:hypothetical protein